MRTTLGIFKEYVNELENVTPELGLKIIEMSTSAVGRGEKRGHPEHENRCLWTPDCFHYSDTFVIKES